MTGKKMADPQASPNSSPNNLSTSSDRAVIFELQKNDSELLRVSVSEYRGRRFVDLRVWYPDGNGEYKPSSKGVTIRPDLVAQVIQGLTLAARAVDPQGVR